jgi:hypothetical protein
MKLPAFLLLFAALIAPGWAQVSISLKLDHKQHLLHEPVTAVVTITNRSGRELDYQSRLQGRIAQSWLNFSMRDGSGKAVTKLHHKVFQRAIIPAGRSMSRRVDLSDMFSVAEVGNYSVTAQVSQPGIDDTAYGSNSGHFTVGGGNILQSLPFGVPDSPVTKREYRVVSFNDGRRTSIYAQVMNSLSSRAISTIRLSEFLSFVKPQIALDGENRLHILYLANPQVFVETTVNQDGRLIGTEYFKRAGGRQPRFVAFSDGKVVVSGAIPFDPAKEAEKAPTRRGVSERPD